jgi:hypothetical protein
LKPFNLEAAKRGEPFVSTKLWFNEPLRFVGTSSDGRIVYERSALICVEDAVNLRMLPRKVGRWVNLYRYTDGTIHTGYGQYITLDEAKRAPHIDTRVSTVWVEWEE